jgi:hypothetical protein
MIFICASALAPCEAKTAHAITQEAACLRLKKVVAKLDGIPESGPVGLGWFCDFSTDHADTSYVIALRSNRKCDSPCSTLMGWYAVDWIDGSVHDFDVAEMKIGASLGASH